MATAKLAYDQAAELLKKLYYELRIEFLFEDELDFELESRGVILPSGCDITRKRKMLRDTMKAEKDGSAEKWRQTIRGDIEKEVKICMQKFGDLQSLVKQSQDEDTKKMCSSRLVHVGMRIMTILTGSRSSPNLFGSLQNALVELVEFLEEVSFINTTVLAQVSNQQLNQPEGETSRAEGSDNQTSVIPQQTEEAGDNRQQMSIFTQEDLEWVHSLQRRIVDLEFELRRQREVREMGTQTVDEFDQLPQYSNSQFQTVNSWSISSLPSQNLPPSNLTFQNPRQNSTFTILDRSNPTRVGTSQVQPVSNHPNVEQASIFNQQRLNSPSHHNSNPEPSYRTHVPQVNVNPRSENLIGQSSFGRSNPVYQPYTSIANVPPYQPRHTLPVSKWNIVKYSGDDQGLQLNEFLEHVHALSLAEHVSERELFESAVHLFSGSALKWYMSQRATNRLLDWQHLVFELRRAHMHPDLDALIKMKIYQRRQQKHESFHEYYFEIDRLFRSMCMQIPDYEKVQILQQNMRIDYKRHMTFLPITDLETLVAAGQKLDALNFSVYSKVFGSEKTVHAVENDLKPKSKSGQKVASGTRTQQTISVVRQSRQNGNERHTNPSKQSPPTRANASQNRPPAQQSSTETQNSARNPSSSSLTLAGPSTYPLRPQLTLEELVNRHSPPPNNTCFNCRKIGHEAPMCRQPKAIFCSNGGLHGFPTNFCPYCVKNGKNAGENRRSQ